MPEEFEIVTKPFKKARLKCQRKYPPRRRIKSVSPCGVSDTVCISVEDEHYLTDGCLVTHNTRVAILLQQKRKCNCLIVCPAYLVSNWKKEILKWAPHALVTTFKSGKEIYDVCDSDFVVISYDLAQKAEHLFEWADMVVGDELHHLKNMAAKRSQFFHRVIYENSIKYLHGLTGTPIKNRVREFYSLIALMYYDPQLDKGFSAESANTFGKFLEKNLPKSKLFLDVYPDEITFADQFSFSKTYEIKVKGHRVPITNYYGLRNKKELKTWLKGRYLRIRADKNDLPPISYLDTLVSDIDNTALLQAFEDYFISDAEAYAKGKGSEYAIRKKRTSSVLPEHKRNAALQKVPFTIKYVENLLESAECCLIYSDHREPCQLLAKHFNVPAITGEMPAHRRAQLVTDFQSGKINTLCATIGALKEGSDLFRSKDMVLNDPAWTPGDISQVINRMRALGEKDPRTVHRILGSPQDAKIWEVLEEKMKTIDQAT
jgi:SNF2 family DNA or RNA helicase